MDDSEPARAALEYALSEISADEVTVLHALEDSGGSAGRPPAVAGEVGADDPAFFGDVRSIAEDHDASVETVVAEGAPADAILAYVDDAGVDRIVMGTRGRTGISRLVLGSVAEAVARRSPVPVTIVP